MSTRVCSTAECSQSLAKSEECMKDSVNAPSRLRVKIGRNTEAF